MKEYGAKQRRKGQTKRNNEIPNVTHRYGTVGRAVAQSVSRWLPTAAARVRVRAACGVCGRQSGIGAGFLRVLRFPLPIIPPISPSS
jgi:ribosomal protein S14